jgi:hypothetical protein
MADKHPYTPAQGPIIQTVNQFRKSFPQSVTSDTLKKLGIAPKNESRVINVLRFLGFVDQDGNKTDVATRIFSIHENNIFAQEFGIQVALSYKQLFDLHQEGTWNLGIDTLISYFRVTDDSTELVGKLQAQTFQVLAGISGHGELPVQKPTTTKPSKPLKKKTKSTNICDSTTTENNPDITQRQTKERGDFGLTVRIEVNLPADGNQETYDRIFRSIRENLLNE